MRKRGFVPIAIACMFLTGCASQTYSESQYFSDVRAHVPQLADGSDSELRTSGQQVCTLMRSSSKPWDGAFIALSEAGLPGNKAAVFITYAVGEYCPKLLHELPNY